MQYAIDHNLIADRFRQYAKPGAELPSEWLRGQDFSEAVEPGTIRESAKPRKHALYLNVVSHGPLVIAKMPDEFIRWAEVRQRIFDFMKRDLGVKVKDILSLEGVAGLPEREAHNDDPEFVTKCEKAFGGSSDYLKAFTLYAWDDATRTFKLARASTK